MSTFSGKLEAWSTFTVPISNSSYKHLRDIFLLPKFVAWKCLSPALRMLLLPNLSEAYKILLRESLAVPTLPNADGQSLVAPDNPPTTRHERS